ncbi:TonB-dependent receptor plug domain-containing protein [Kingella potus]|uniref:TonB-dependent receptor plug domain-containing protein n=1 Tax=Kingella potus TaxID=265175 RepID=UPI001FD0055D|nr:TonB-dependent receptor plug domain-containing protein [Kingella potus]UOP01274.1 TonB-dependent receptor plug domain-containing protein [Kingella potus]
MKTPFRLSLIALALLPLSARADTAAQDVSGLDTVTVTGSKPASLNQGYSTDGTYAPLGIAMTLRETPQSVSVTTSKQMEDWKLDSLRKVMEQTNGVTVKSGSGGSDRYAGLHARGMEVKNFQIDGVPLRSSGFQQRLVDGLERCRHPRARPRGSAARRVRTFGRHGRPFGASEPGTQTPHQRL